MCENGFESDQKDPALARSALVNMIPIFYVFSFQSTVPVPLISYRRHQLITD
jgi:hypothetical protein